MNKQDKEKMNDFINRAKEFLIQEENEQYDLKVDEVMLIKNETSYTNEIDKITAGYNLGFFRGKNVNFNIVDDSVNRLRTIISGLIILSTAITHPDLTLHEDTIYETLELLTDSLISIKEQLKK